MSVAEIMSLLDRTPLTPEESFNIWSHLHRKGGLKRPGPQVGEACMRLHPETPSRWSYTPRRRTSKVTGKVTTFESRVCLECVSARDARLCKRCRGERVERPAATTKCPGCPHPRRIHRKTDGGRCYHVNSAKEYDCDCTGERR